VGYILASSVRKQIVDQPWTIRNEVPMYSNRINLVEALVRNHREQAKGDVSFRQCSNPSCRTSMAAIAMVIWAPPIV
jgi:hypothetical protein